MIVFTLSSVNRTAPHFAEVEKYEYDLIAGDVIELIEYFNGPIHLVIFLHEVSHRLLLLYWLLAFP